jgi:hypothetical protein
MEEDMEEEMFEEEKQLLKTYPVGSLGAALGDLGVIWLLGVAMHVKHFVSFFRNK